MCIIFKFFPDKHMMILPKTIFSSIKQNYSPASIVPNVLQHSSLCSRPVGIKCQGKAAKLNPKKDKKENK